MEACRSGYDGRVVKAAAVEIFAAEIVLAAAESLVWFVSVDNNSAEWKHTLLSHVHMNGFFHLFRTGSLSSEIATCMGSELFNRLPLIPARNKSAPVPENKDDGDSEDDDEDDEDADEDDGGEEDASGDEGDENEGDEGEAEDPAANGAEGSDDDDGGEEDDDDDDDDDDGEDEDEDDEDEDEDEDENPEPPTKKRK